MKTHPNLKAAFEILSQSQLGKQALQDLLPLVDRGEIRISSTTKVNEALNHPVLPTGSPAGGFVFDGSSKIIHLDLNQDARLLAALLIHEISHCLDQEYIRTFAHQETLREKLSEATRELARAHAPANGEPLLDLTLSDLSASERQHFVGLAARLQKCQHRRLFLTERKAYTAAYRWATEACATILGYREFLAHQRSEGYVLDRPISDEEIIQGYGLNPSFLGDLSRQRAA